MRLCSLLIFRERTSGVRMVLRSHLKRFEVSVSQFTKSKCLGLTKRNASLTVSQSLAFTIRHPFCQWVPISRVLRGEKKEILLPPRFVYRYLLSFCLFRLRNTPCFFRNLSSLSSRTQSLVFQYLCNFQFNNLLGVF